MNKSVTAGTHFNARVVGMPVSSEGMAVTSYDLTY